MINLTALVLFLVFKNSRLIMNKVYELYEFWNDLSVNKSDPRTTNWFMMSSPVPSALICLSYVIFVLLGPTIMKNREPFKINHILIVYNFLMVILSGYLFYEVNVHPLNILDTQKCIKFFVLVPYEWLVVRLLILLSAGRQDQLSQSLTSN